MKRVWMTSAVAAFLLAGPAAHAEEQSPPTRLECRVVDGPNPAQRGSVLMLTMATHAPPLRLEPMPVLDPFPPAPVNRIVDPFPASEIVDPMPAFDPNALVDPFEKK